MRSVQDQINRWKRLQAGVTVAIVAGLAAFYFLGYRPANARLRSLGERIAARQTELQRNQSRTSNMTILAAHVRQLQQRVDSFDRQFPRDAELGPFIRDITRISQQLALQDWRYAPGMSVRRDSLFELPIRMQFNGDFVNVASFLRQVEGMQRLTRVKFLSVRSREGRPGWVDVELAMSIYFSER